MNQHTQDFIALPVAVLPANGQRFAIVERTVEEAQQALVIQHKPDPISRQPEIVQRPVRARYNAD
jgi:hypothetical protein